MKRIRELASFHSWRTPNHKCHMYLEIHRRVFKFADNTTRWTKEKRWKKRQRHHFYRQFMVLKMDQTMGISWIGACFAVVGVFFLAFPLALSLSLVSIVSSVSGCGRNFIVISNVRAWKKKRHKKCLPINIWHKKETNEKRNRQRDQ